MSIVVVANGDLNTAANLDECRDVSGCSHFMLGRGPMGRPSLVCDAPANPANADPDTKLLADLLLEYIELLARAGSSEERQIARVKQWLSLGQSANPTVTPLFERVKRLRTRPDVCAALRAS